MKIEENSVTYVQSNVEYVDNTQNKAVSETEGDKKAEIKKQSNSAGTTAISSEDYENTTYSREEINVFTWINLLVVYKTVSYT